MYPFTLNLAPFPAHFTVSLITSLMTGSVFNLSINSFFFQRQLFLKTDVRILPRLYEQEVYFLDLRVQSFELNQFSPSLRHSNLLVGVFHKTSRAHTGRLLYPFIVKK